jgi:hypothetical protein
VSGWGQGRQPPEAVARAAPALSPADHRSTSKTQLLPGDRASLPPSSTDRFCLSPVGPTQLRELDASIGASGPHDFAVRCNISRQHAGDLSQVFRPALQSRCAQDAAASTASAPRVRDDRDTPLWWGGMANVLEVFRGGWKQKYFCKGDSTQKCPTGKSPHVGETVSRVPGAAQRLRAAPQSRDLHEQTPSHTRA